jgi:hypothetical protein
VLGDVTVQDAVLATRSDKPNAPAYAKIDLSLVDHDGQVRDAQLMFAESWWTNSILVPNFRELFAWGFVVVPMMLGLQGAGRVCHAANKAWKSLKQKHLLEGCAAVTQTLSAFVYLLAGIALAIPLEIVLALLFVMGLLPIPKWRELILKVQLTLVGSVGQSYVLVSGPIRLAAMVGQVSHDLRWLCQHCRTVMIVAHSQGAAIVHHALLKEVLPEVRELVTLGSGLKQLTILLEEQRSTSIIPSAWVSLVGFALTIPGIAVTIPGMLNYFPAFHWTDHPSGVITFGCLMWTIGALALVLSVARRKPDYWNWNKHLHVRWTDFYASRDPVPNGPLVDNPMDTDLKPGPHPKRVHNFASLIADHVTYWQNAEQVVATLAFDIAQWAGLPINNLIQGDLDRLMVADERRRRRVRKLEWGRYTAIATAGLFLLTFAVDPVQRHEALENLRPLLNMKVGDVNAWAQAASMFLPLAVIVVCYGLMLISWKYWTEAEITTLTQRSIYTFDSVGTWALIFFVLWGFQGAGLTFLLARLLPPLLKSLAPVWAIVTFLGILLHGLIAFFGAEVWCKLEAQLSAARALIERLRKG